MDKLDFTLFRDAVASQFKKLYENKDLVFIRTKISGDSLYQLYLNSFPKEVNGIFRVRQHYDGNYDKNFIRRLGNIIALDSKGNRYSIWDVVLPSYFNDVAKALHIAVINSPFDSPFVTLENHAGSKPSIDSQNPDITWIHFYSTIPSRFISTKDYIGTKVGEINTDLSLFKRGLEELTLDAAETILELIESNSIYRGEEHKANLKSFINFKKEYELAKDKEAYIYYTVYSQGSKVRFKNSVIGTLVDDLSQGIDLEKAVKMFESKVAPQNYKRTTALITPRMVEQAQKTLEDNGLLDSIYRRYATKQDLNVNNILFTSQEVKSLNVFDDLKKDANNQVTQKNIDKVLSNVEEITIDKFIEAVLPTAKQIEILVENKHTNNFMSLITEQYPNSEHLFKWNNSFSWSYNGELADSSLKSKVHSLGGRVDGVLRFSHTWNYDSKKPNQSLMDLHVFFPGYVDKHKDREEIHNSYPSCRRVGWNHRQDYASKANQDVDYTAEPGLSVPVENITFPSLAEMPDGIYTFKIHNWSLRQPTKSGFKAEIEFNGNIFEYEHENPLKHHQWITLAEVTLKNGQFSIDHKLSTTASSKEIWNVNTNTFVPVNTICFSPNYWDENSSGNKHVFFLMDDCKNPEESRGFYNEFLKSDLEQHRKVFEMLASKTKAEHSDNQLSGLGFSLTKKDEITLKVTGKTKRTFKVKF